MGFCGLLYKEWQKYLFAYVVLYLVSDRNGCCAREFEEMLEIEKQRAKERKEANLKEGNEQPRRGNVSTSGEEGKAREKAAEKIDAGVSDRTLQHYVGFRRASFQKIRFCLNRFERGFGFLG